MHCNTHTSTTAVLLHDTQKSPDLGTATSSHTGSRCSDLLSVHFAATAILPSIANMSQTGDWITTGKHAKRDRQGAASHVRATTPLAEHKSTPVSATPSSVHDPKVSTLHTASNSNDTEDQSIRFVELPVTQAPPYTTNTPESAPELIDKTAAADTNDTDMLTSQGDIIQYPNQPAAVKYGALAPPIDSDADHQSRDSRFHDGKQELLDNTTNTKPGYSQCNNSNDGDIDMDNVEHKLGPQPATINRSHDTNTHSNNDSNSHAHSNDVHISSYPHWGGA